jgi:anti-sigma factor RsiW
MRCDEVQALLIEVADGALAGALPPEVERHLTDCGACRAEAAALRELLRTVAQDPVPEPPAPYWTASREEMARRLGLRQRAARPARPFPVRTWAWAGAAAALLLVVGVTLLAGRGLFPFAPSGPTPEETALLPNLEVVRDLELLEEVDILQDYELLRTLASQGRAT